MNRFGTLPYRLLRLFRIPAPLHWHLATLVNHRFLLGVVGVIYDEQGRLLLFHHTYRSRHPWGLPGGWMRRGESPPEGLRREVREESGLELDLGRLLMIGTTADRSKMEFVVGAQVIGGTFRPSGEVDQMGWYAPDELPPLPSFHSRILTAVADLGPGEVGWYDSPWVFNPR